MKLLMGEVHRRRIVDSIPVGGKFLEYGSGGSSIWFEKHLPEGASMISVEHHPEWAEKVASQIGPRCNVISTGGVAGKNATFLEEDPTKLQEYVKAADDQGPFDTILVDGVARLTCLIHCRKLLKKNGTIFVHDYQRGWYRGAEELFDTIEIIGSQPDYPKPTLWVGKHTSDVIIQETNQVKKLPTSKRQLDKILWVMNVCWIGGTAGWVLDCVKTMKQWKHEVVYVNGHQDHTMAEQFKHLGISVSKIDDLDRKVLDAVSPGTVILLNTSSIKIPDQAYLKDNHFVVNVHHSYVRPTLYGADYDVFVSQYLKDQFSNDFKWMKNLMIIHPGVETMFYSGIMRPNREIPVIGQLAGDNDKKFPKELFEIAAKFPDYKWRIMGMKDIPDYANVDNVDNVDNVEIIPFGKEKVDDFLRSIDIFVYRTDIPDTWARSVTEAMASGLPCVVGCGSGPAEQIDHDVNGIICKDDKEYVDGIKFLIENREKRVQMGEAAKDKAVFQYDCSIFGRQISPLMIKELLRV